MFLFFGQNLYVQTRGCNKLLLLSAKLKVSVCFIFIVLAKYATFYLYCVNFFTVASIISIFGYFMVLLLFIYFCFLHYFMLFFLN